MVTLKTRFILLFILVFCSPHLVVAFTSSISTLHNDASAALGNRRLAGSSLCAELRKNVEIPLLDLIDRTAGKNNVEEENDAFIVPLPSSGFPDQLATPFLYGMQMDVPLHKLILEEAISMAEATTASRSSSIASLTKPYYGHLVWN